MMYASAVSDASNCIEFDSGGKCIKCGKGYYLWTSDASVCRKCDTTCKECVGSSDACTSCNDDRYLNSDTKKCDICGANCLKCASLVLCETCLLGFYKDADTTACLSCTFNCVRCTSSLSCDECQSDYYIEVREGRQACLRNRSSTITVIGVLLVLGLATAAAITIYRMRKEEHPLDGAEDDYKETL